MVKDFKKFIETYWKLSQVEDVLCDFENAMRELGFEKKDERKQQGKVYKTYDDYGNRATCYAYADSDDTFGKDIFSVVCRKKCGDYLIISYQRERVAEIDFRGFIHYNEEMLQECIKEYKPFFDRVMAFQGWV